LFNNKALKAEDKFDMEVIVNIFINDLSGDEPIMALVGKGSLDIM
jgi:hypothetical protein